MQQTSLDVQGPDVKQHGGTSCSACVFSAPLYSFRKLDHLEQFEHSLHVVLKNIISLLPQYYLTIIITFLTKLSQYLHNNTNKPTPYSSKTKKHETKANYKIIRRRFILIISTYLLWFSHYQSQNKRHITTPLQKRHRCITI